MKNISLILLLVFLIVNCRNKKHKLADDDSVAITDFVDFFDEIKLPFFLNDSILLRKETDSASIGFKIFTQFVPDSVLSNQFASGVKPSIYPLGKVVIKKFETYLFLKAITPSKKVGYIIALDNDNKFIAAMPLVIADKDPSTLRTGGMDEKYTVTETVQKKAPDGQLSESKNVYILNSEAKAFSLIMTDQGVAEEEQDIINPIDTFPKKNIHSGDYIKDKRNFISIRDGKIPSALLFFIHFEKDNGECKGELKGEANLHGTKTAIYRANDNPCVLDFTFKANAVSVKELEACGSNRDIKCFFEGSYVKRKDPKARANAKKGHSTFSKDH